MKTQTWLSALVPALGIPCLAAPLSTTSQPRHGTIALPVRKSLIVDKLARRGLRSSLTNTYYQYLIDLEVGTPPQPVTVSIDTGSSDTWFVGPDSCASCSGGIFDPSQSSTGYTEPDLGPFSASYFDGTAVSGYYITDTVEVGSATVSGVTIAVATAAPANGYGILGLGLEGLETSAVQHPELLDDLYNQGIISSRSYSIYLDELSASSGFILFGGVDSSKYSGDLVSLPIVPYTDSLPRLQVDWTYLSITDETDTTTTLTQSTFSYPVAMDTGYTTSVLPTDTFDQLANYFGVIQQNGGYFVPCDLPDGYFTFGFGEGPAVTIQVPFSEIAVPESSGGSEYCLFGFLPQTDDVISFGDTFLRSAYLYYDFDDSTISLAQAVWT